MNVIKRQSVTISLLDQGHNPTIVWKLANALPIKIQVSDMKSDGNEVAVETLKQAYEALTISTGK